MKDLGPDKRAFLNDYMTHITGIVKISRQAKGDEKTKNFLLKTVNMPNW